MVNRVSCDSTQEGTSEQQITSDAVIEVANFFFLFFCLINQCIAVVFLIYLAIVGQYRDSFCI